jgi:hypothetical protein
MLIDIGFYIYLTLLLFLSVGSWRGKANKSNGRVFLSLLFCFTFLAELLGDILARIHHNNLIVYHCFGPIQFFLICLYYNSCIPAFRRTNIGLYIGILGIIFAVVNLLVIQTIGEFNSNYLLFESIVIIAMALQSFSSIIKREDIDILKHEPFWISVIFLLFWSITYMYWGLGDILSKSGAFIYSITMLLLLTVNLLTYIGFTVIVILGKKNKLLNEN